MAPADFARKLDYVLKGLSISRGRLAMELEVDKSLVSRWASGANQPAEHNLAALTALVAARRPGFTLLDWERDVTEVGAMFGASVTPPAPAPVSTKVFDDWIAESKLRRAAEAAGRLAPGLTGFWRTIVPVINEPGRYLRSHTMMSEVDGSIRVDTLLWGGRAMGWAVTGGNQLYIAIGGNAQFGMSFTILNGLDRLSAGVMDGVWLGCIPAQGGIVSATPVISERLQELSGDRDADLATLEALSHEAEMVSAEALSPAYLERLNSPSGEQLSLMLPALTSLARAATNVAPQASSPKLRVVTG